MVAKKAAASVYLGRMGRNELLFGAILLLSCDATIALDRRFRVAPRSGLSAGLLGFIRPNLRFITRHFLDVVWLE